MKNKKHFVSVTEEIRNIPVVHLLKLEMFMLEMLEDRLRAEAKRTNLAIQWVQGIKRIKMATKDGEQNG